jgi:hypothetical protein
MEDRYKGKKGAGRMGGREVTCKENRGQGTTSENREDMGEGGRA